VNRNFKLIVAVLGTAGALTAGAAHAQQIELPRIEALGKLSGLEGLASLGDLSSLKSLQSLRSLKSLESLGSLKSLESLGSNASLQGLGALRSLASLPELASLGDLGVIDTYTRSQDYDGREISRRLPPASWNPQDPADSLWREARAAVSDGDYRAAARLFARLVDRYPRSDYAGDALYWQAWAIYKNGQENGHTRGALDNALAALDRQADDYPNARTRNDARDLRARVRSAQGGIGNRVARIETQDTAALLVKGNCKSDDDDVRIAALQGLMQMDAESALPILRQVLAKRDACSIELRKQAVFMVSQKRGEESSRILLEVARTDPSGDVRADAIQWLGQSRSDIAIPALDSILNSASDNDVREKAIFALSQQRDASASQVLRRFVENERMPDDLRANGIFWLGQRRDAASAEYLRQLYSRTRSEQLHESIIQAISQSKSGDASKWLFDIASDRDQPIEARKNALFWASQQHQIDFAQLSSFYDNAKGQGDLQEHVIWLLSQRREAEATDKLIDIAQRDPDKERRKNAIFWLGQKKDPRAAKFLADLLK